MYKKKFLLFYIVVFGLFLRIYNFSSTLNHGTDQAAAMIIADRILNAGHTLYVGPLTTAWEYNLLPPTYYYIIAALLAFTGSELGISMAFAAASGVTIFLAYYFSKQIFGAKTGLTAALLWAISTEMIWYGRNFWEPYLVPFFILLCLIAAIKAEHTGKFTWLILSHIAFTASFLYVSPIILLPGYLFLVYSVGSKIGGGVRWGITSVIASFMIIAAFYIPVYIFEASHQYPSLAELTHLTASTSSDGYVKFSIGSFATSVIAHVRIYLHSLGFAPLTFVAVLIAVCVWELRILKMINLHRQWFMRLIIISVAAFLLTGFYGREPYVFRMASLYPVVIPLLSFIFTRILSLIKFSKIPAACAVVLIFLYFKNNTYQYTSIAAAIDYFRNKEIEAVATYIKDQSANDTFTIYSVTPSEKNNHHGTRYYWALEKLTGKRFAQLSARGNWIEQNLNKKVSKIFLVCSEFSDREQAVSECLEYFRSQEGLPQPLDMKEFSDTIVYTIPGSLP